MRSYTIFIGQQFCCWTVLAELPPKNRVRYWECQCVCGKARTVSGAKLIAGKSRSCGCQGRHNQAELRKRVTSSMVFGNWVVIGFGSRIGTSACWQCRCVCGAVKNVKEHRLLSGESLSCGCIKKGRHGHAAYREGKRSSTYGVWTNMWSRCTNPKCPAYRYYGERGITVCDRWRKFENFLADMGEKPENLSIDRIHVNGNYEPDNCRWADAKTQANNQRPRQKKLKAVLAA